MEMAISGISTSFSLTKLPQFPPSSKFFYVNAKKTLNKGVICKFSSNKASLFGSSKGGGAGVLERPTFDQSQFDLSPEAEEGGDMGRMNDKKGYGSGDSYKVLLVDHTRHTEKLVAKVLPGAVPSVKSDDARKLFHESRQIGVAVVIVTVKEHAEFYAQMMMRGGLRSAIEPDSDTL